MDIKKKTNSGFTLIELIIAMAMLAFVMTAVSAFMGSGVVGYKKSKADINVHNSAQETYNQLVDTAMQANDIVIFGYTTVNPTASVFFEEGKDLSAVFNPKPVYYVRDKEQADYVKTKASYYDGSSDIKLYSDLAAGQKVYVKQIIVESATPFDSTFATASGTDMYYNNFTAEYDTVKPEQRITAGGASENVTSVTGDVVYSKNDTLRTIYTFEAENLYCETEYAYMTLLNDIATSGNKSACLYSESFNYGVGKDSSDAKVGDISGCVVTLDVSNGSISFDLDFSDKNMTYETQGMVKFRNSYVLREKQ